MSIILRFLSARGALKTLTQARALLQTRTPLKTNCGKLCGGACCQSDETGENGMLLFPFEEKFYSSPIEGFPFRLLPDDTLVKGGYRLVCEGLCPREHRPLACRLFPLRIRMVFDALGENTRALAEMDPRAGALCPLPDMGGMRALDPAFVAAVEAAGNALLTNVYMLEALGNEEKWVKRMREF